MKLLDTTKIETYQIYEHDEIRLDFVTTDKCYEGWLYIENNAHKMYMYGLYKENVSRECALAMFVRDIEEYLPDYIEELDWIEEKIEEKYL